MVTVRGEREREGDRKGHPYAGGGGFRLFEVLFGMRGLKRTSPKLGSSIVSDNRNLGNLHIETL